MDYYREKKPKRWLVWVAAALTFTATLTLLWTTAGGITA